LRIYKRIKDLKAKYVTTRRRRIIFACAIVLCVMVAMANIGVAVWSAFPSFCRSCHHIEPFYQSWLASKHGEEGVGCLECHVKPGAYYYVKRKIMGLEEVVKYASGGYPSKLRAEVHDDSCLREGCHSRAKLEADVMQFGKVKFPHAKHKDTLRGLNLRCGSCHAMSLHSKDDTVSQQLCFICHFKPGGSEETVEEAKVREDIGRCQGCHDIPKQVVTKAGTTFDHASYAAPGAKCSSCHAHLTEGDGSVPRQRCYSCHNRGLGHEERATDIVLIHEQHGNKTQVECRECHDELRHKPVGFTTLAKGECRNCHGALHASKQGLYRGTGGVGVEDLPDVMFASEVQCAGCHAAAHKDVKPGDVAALPSEGCVACHGDKRYGRTAEQWVSTFNSYLSKLEAAVKTGYAMPDLGPKAKKYLAAATRNIELVREARAVHNVRYAADCLRQAQAGLATIPGLEQVATTVPTYAGEGAGCVDMCHIGVEAIKSVKFAEKGFPHSEHAVSPLVKCSQCHSTAKKQHGETFTKAVGDCYGCHHKTEKNCKSCHPVQTAVYFGKVEGDSRGEPAGMAAKKVVCEGCHKGVSKGHTRDTVRQLCIDCHGKKKAYGKMLDEWQGGIQEELERLEKLLIAGRAKLAAAPDVSAPEAVALRKACDKAQKVVELIRDDGSGGGHNIDFFDTILTDEQRAVRRSLKKMK